MDFDCQTGGSTTAVCAGAPLGPGAWAHDEVSIRTAFELLQSASPAEREVAGRSYYSRKQPVGVEKEAMTNPQGHTMPRAERPTVPEGYGMPQDPEGMLSWEWAEERLTVSMNYWIGTVRPNGRPHSTPVWGVWFAGGLYFDGSDQTRRMKNIAANPDVAVHLESGDEVVILEGRASTVGPPPERALAEALAAQYKEKYRAHAYAPSRDQWDQGGLYVLRPRLALGWTFRPAEVFGRTYTRWRF